MQTPPGSAPLPADPAGPTDLFIGATPPGARPLSVAARLIPVGDDVVLVIPREGDEPELFSGASALARLNAWLAAAAVSAAVPHSASSG